MRLATPTTRTRLEKKHPLAIRWLHWINFPALIVMIWSGLLIYWANDAYRIGWGETTLFKFFPDKFYERTNIGFRLAEGMAWHFVFAWLFTLNGIAYGLYVWLSGEWRHLLPRRDSLKEAFQVVLHDVGIRKKPLPPAKFNHAQRIAYTSAIVMGALMVVTGLAIYKPTQLSWLVTLLGGYQAARLEHFVVTWLLVAFFLVHVAQVAKAGWNNFRAMITGYEVASVPATTPIQPVNNGEGAVS
jgi:thiosulfate reductase cytochrome b subunit